MVQSRGTRESGNQSRAPLDEPSQGCSGRLAKGDIPICHTAYQTVTKLRTHARMGVPPQPCCFPSCSPSWTSFEVMECHVCVTEWAKLGNSQRIAAHERSSTNIHCCMNSLTLTRHNGLKPLCGRVTCHALVECDDKVFVSSCIQPVTAFNGRWAEQFGRDFLHCGSGRQLCEMRG